MVTTLPKDARICRDCSNLVTTDASCPLCDQPTLQHPDSEQREHYCVDCADGPFRSETLHLVTWNENAYLQTDDGDLSCLCAECHKAREADAL